jgi:hypothetical protein
MSNAHDRRAPGTTRVPFDAIVEVGGALGPSFEAQAVNLSEGGMSLRTAYLPEVGQPVMCRFDAGHGLTVVAAGEVLWKDDMGDGGEFGIRFTNLDAQSTAALQRILGMAEEGRLAPAPLGRKVRLHIEGLASPMRARIRDFMATGATAYSELGFLQMGRPLELEDASSGERRPAVIDRVHIEVDEDSRIPQLVVSLRYDDTDARAAAVAPIEDAMGTPRDPEDVTYEQQADAAPPAEQAQENPAAAEIEVKAESSEAGEEGDEERSNLKDAIARKAAKVTPAIAAWAKRAKVAAALLAARARRRQSTGDDVAIPVRRTTAPAPGGGLHASGRKVVRGSSPDLEQAKAELAAPRRRFEVGTKKIAIAGSIGIATILVGIAIFKPSPAPQLASAPPEEPPRVTTSTPITTAAATTAVPVPPPLDPLAAATSTSAQPGRPAPFVNGRIGSRPNIVKIKMDGPIEAIQGAAQPTGFTVLIPSRKPIEPTSILAEKDPRIASVHVSNDGSGTELTVSFKDGVPPYMVRANGETLEMVLARPSAHGEKAAANAKKKNGKKR